MRLLHLGDLHIGKRVNEFPLLDDQRHILDQLVQIARERVDAVLIAGDVFDKAVPSVEALELCEWFLGRLAACKLPVFIIAGNHDSAERLAFGSAFMGVADIHIARPFEGTVECFEGADEFGPLSIYLLPFLKPLIARLAYPSEEIASYNDAVAVALAHVPLDSTRRNILVAHQFVTNKGILPQTCESETIAVGGMDNVEASLFDRFDYVALGHLHGHQSVLRPQVRYCGSPLKYSFSEAHHEKVATIVNLRAKGDVSINEVPLIPRRDMREIKGSFDELVACAGEDAHREDYLHVTLTDERCMDAMARLRAYYPNIMKLDFERAITRGKTNATHVAAMKTRSVAELFSDLYAAQTGDELDEPRRVLLNRAIEEAQEVAK